MVKYIELTKGKFAVIDDDDFERVSQHQWHAHRRADGGSWYGRVNLGRWPNQKPVYLHRFIMQAEKGQMVDHIDGNGLNCQRSNMRLCTQKENRRNAKPNKNSTSRYKGVSWSRRDKKWIAQISVNGSDIYLGAFRDETKAAKAYDEAARKYHGDFAWTNF